MFPRRRLQFPNRPEYPNQQPFPNEPQFPNQSPFPQNPFPQPPYPDPNQSPFPQIPFTQPPYPNPNQPLYPEEPYPGGNTGGNGGGWVTMSIRQAKQQCGWNEAVEGPWLFQLLYGMDLGLCRPLQGGRRGMYSFSPEFFQHFLR